jgi:hypothetical protein
MSVKEKGNAKRPATPFSTTLGGRSRCGTNWPKKLLGILTLLKIEEKGGFLTASCGPYMGHTLRLFFNISP